MQTSAELVGTDEARVAEFGVNAVHIIINHMPDRQQALLDIVEVALHNMADLVVKEESFTDYQTKKKTHAEVIDRIHGLL